MFLRKKEKVTLQKPSCFVASITCLFLFPLGYKGHFVQFLRAPFYLLDFGCCQSRRQNKIKWILAYSNSYNVQ